MKNDVIYKQFLVNHDGRIFRTEPEETSGKFVVRENVPNIFRFNENIVTPLGAIEMLWVNPGEFLMGSPESEKGRYEDEGPQTHVLISKGFWLGKFPVTQKQYQEIVGNNPSYFKESGENAPVENISWNDAMEFCEKLNAKISLPSGYKFTLPTEAQWEYACRAGTTTPVSGNNNLDDMGWFADNSENKPHPTGLKLPNHWGFHDMHGNVWEWCANWYCIKYSGKKETDPVGPTSGTHRVIRAGGWLSSARSGRSAARFSCGPVDRCNSMGFRLALSSVPCG